MKRWTATRAGVLAALLGTSIGAHAASYDPDLTWRTLQTEHFNIHFHQGEEQLADEFSSMVEDVYDTMIEEMRWEPRRGTEVLFGVRPGPRMRDFRPGALDDPTALRKARSGRTDITLIDRTDFANGFARSVPVRSIVIYVTAPEAASGLNLYEDWGEAIFAHELTHVLHMDANHGLVRAARWVVGSIASQNNLSPAWVVEGLATFQETRHTSGGRGRSAWPDMYIRTAVLEDAFPPLGNMDGFQPYPPSGNLRYVFGQDLMQYIADHAGHDVWTRWTHLQGSGYLPFWIPSRRAFVNDAGDAQHLPESMREEPTPRALRKDRRLLQLYYDWRDHLHDKYGAQAETVRAEGETQSRLVSGGEASCQAPAFSPDGDRLVWSCYDLHTGSAIWMSDGSGYAREILLKDRGASYFTWRQDSAAFVFASSHLVNKFNHWSDISMLVVGSDSATSLTSGARARDPDFSPDGTQLLYVTNKAQNNQLERMTVDRRREKLTDFSDHTQLSTPRFSPDGAAVALSMWRDGRRDLWLFSPDGAPLRRLTADAAMDADPVWSSDGRWLYFSSDRSGIPNIYAVELATERLYQVTNVLTGAAKPSLHPDGTLLAFQQYSENGWDVRIQDLDHDAFLDRGLLPRPLRYGTPLAELVSPVEREDDDAQEVAALWEAAEPGLPARVRPDLYPTALHPVGMEQAPPEEVLQGYDDADVEDVFGEEQDYPFRIEPRRYNPLPTLIPRYVIPFVQTTPFESGPALQPACDAVLGWADLFCPGIQGTLASSAVDTLQRFGWSALVNYRTDAEAAGAAASVTLNRFLPVYSAGASTTAVSTARLLFLDPEAITDASGELEVLVPDPDILYWERRSQAWAQVSWPYKIRETAFARYSLTHRTELFDLDGFELPVYLPAVPLRGTVGTISAGWRHSWSQGTALAISPEDAEIFSLVGSLLHPWLGTFVRDDDGNLQPLSQVQLTSELREYIVNPLIPNHVFAARLAGGVALGGTDFLGNYLLGGSIGDGAFYVTPSEARMLRGYPFAYDIGDMYWLTGFEYRFPLWHVQRGVGTIPLYARNLSGALFVDAGNAFNNPSLETGRAATLTEIGEAAIEDPLVGVGGELLGRAVMLWGVGITARLGYAYPISNQPPRDPGTEELGEGYLQFGGSF